MGLAATSDASPLPKGKSPSRTKFLAIIVVILIILAGLLGSGLVTNSRIQQMISPQSQPPPQNISISSSSITTTFSTMSTSTINQTPTSSASIEPQLNFSSLPPPPSVVGCYRYSSSQGAWQSVACVSPQSVLQFGLPPLSVLGINSGSPGAGVQSTLLNSALVQINFGQYGGSTDSIWGDGAYSIQLNTNRFVGTSNNPNGDTDWVQFVYQDQAPACGQYGKYKDATNCAALNVFCIWNNDVTTQNYRPDACVSPSDVGVYLHDGYSAAIYGFTVNQNLVSEAFLPGTDPLSIVAPDLYGLAGGWYQVSGNILGAGGRSMLQFAGFPNEEQTNVGVASCNTRQAIVGRDCTPISGSSYQESNTGESNDFSKYEANPTLTSYYSDSHWWISSVSCEDAMSIVFECNQWNGGGSILGSGRRMTYTVAVNPDSGSTNAGYDSATMVTVTSTNGVQVGDITFKLDGLEGLGTEAPPLSDATCTFNSPLQPGSTCSFILDISTYNTDPLGTYTLTILASSQGTTGASAQYALTISSPVAPSPVIVSPTDGASFAVNQPFTLIGYARTTAAGAFVGSVPCSQMQFQVTAPDGSTQSYTPTEDQSYPQTGYCDSPQISFSVQGVASITLTASDNGITGTSQVVSVNVVSQQQQQTNPFSFSLGASAQSGALNAYSVSSATFTIQVTISGTPQPVQLSVSGLPSDVTYSFSANPVTPTGSIGTSTLTITTSDATAEGTYTLTISGMAGGITESTTVTLQIVKLA